VGLVGEKHLFRRKTGEIGQGVAGGSWRRETGKLERINETNERRKTNQTERENKLQGFSAFKRKRKKKVQRTFLEQICIQMK
jgi:hypothetical protein